VAPLVATQGLSSGETFVTDRTLMNPPAAIGGSRGSGGRGRLLVGSGVLPVTGLVAAESLVRAKSFVAYATLVN